MRGGGFVAGFLTLKRGADGDVGGVGLGRNDAGRNATVVLLRGGNVTRNAWIGNSGVAGVVAIENFMLKLIRLNEASN